MPDIAFEFIHIVFNTLANIIYKFEVASIPLYISYLFIFYIVFETLKMIIVLSLNKQLSFISNKWDRSDSNKAGKKILILGDSTAVGTGASSIEETIAGRLRYDFPDAEIKNLGVNGCLIKDVKKQIDTVSDQKFDLIIISAGGNDVWNFSNQKSIKANLAYIFNLANQMANGRVFFLIYNNLGDAPIFPSIIRSYLKKRCAKIQKSIETTAFSMRVSTIKIYSDDKNNPFIKNPKTFFAKDGIHPSSEGYKLWYLRMWLELVNRGFRLNR